MVRPLRAGFLKPFGCGEFIRAYLSANPEHISGVLDREGNPLVLPDPAQGAYIDAIRAAYKHALQWQYAQDMAGIALGKGVVLSVEEALRRIPQRLTKVRSHSFHRYFHMLKQLGWVEVTGEEEPSDLGGRVGARVEHIEKGRALVEVPQPRRFYRLSAAGTAASVRDWADPLVALYGYSQDERRGTAPPLPRPRTLPRAAPRIAKAPAPAPRPVGKPRAKAPAAVKVPAYQLPESPGRAAAQGLIRHLLTLNQLGAETAPVEAELNRLGDAMETWLDQIDAAVSEAEDKEKPNQARIDRLGEQRDAAFEAQQYMEQHEIENAIENLNEAFPSRGT